MAVMRQDNTVWNRHRQASNRNRSGAGYSILVALMLLVGQMLLFGHAVQHELTPATDWQQEIDECGFCVVGGHLSTVAPVASPSAPLAWLRVVHPVNVSTYPLSQHNLLPQARAPPLTAAA